MQKTNKELAEFYGFEIGDTVRIYFNEKDYKDYKVILFDDIKLEPIGGNFLFDPFIIADRKYEVIKPKKYGDLKCNYNNCKSCPLYLFHCNHTAANTLYGVLEETCLDKDGCGTDHPIYKAFKVELDKEVE